MLKIAVAGLGLIGGSLAAALQRTGKYIVGGANRSRGPVDFALSHRYIDEEAADLCRYDVVFVALPPDVTIRFLDEIRFADGAVVADICGVKRVIRDAVYAKPRNYRYVGTHPMAGKEVSGIEHASAELFRGANLVLTTCEQTDREAFALLRQLADEIGFGKIVVCDAEEHDRKIALTSQLAHIVSNAYIKSPQIDGCLGFTGGSFQDMTRIAAVDETVWTDLYLNNRENLSAELRGLIAALTAYADALDARDRAALLRLLREGRERKEGLGD